MTGESSSPKIIGQTPPSSSYCDLAQIVGRTPSKTHIEKANTPSPLSLENAIRENLIGFSFDMGSQELTFQGKSGSQVLFIGDASEKVHTKETVRIDMLLFLNNELVVSTPVTFTEGEQIKSFSANKTMFLNNGDKLKIMIKSSIDNVDLTIEEYYVQLINLNNSLLTSLGY